MPTEIVTEGGEVIAVPDPPTTAIAPAGGEVIAVPDPPTTAIAPAGGPTPLSLIHAAVEKGITDPGYLEKLLSLQERWEDRQAQAEFASALNRAQSDMGPITKDGENKFNKTRYATLEAVLRAVQPVYLRHGFALSFGQEPTPENREGWLRVFVDVSHTGGHTRRYWGDFPLDSEGSKGGSNKTAIQAVGSAFSYARRYLLGLVFNLVFTNEDNDGQPVGRQQAQQGPQEARQQPRADPNAKITVAQVDELADLIRAANVDIRRFFDLIAAMKSGGVRIEMLDDLPARLFESVRDSLKQKLERQRNGGAK